MKSELHFACSREYTGLSYNTHPIEVWRISTVRALDDNTIRAASAETRQFYRIAFCHIFVPVVTRQREADRLRRTSVDTDRCIALVVAGVTGEGEADITVDIVEAHSLSSLAGADVAQRESTIGRASQVADLVVRCAARARGDARAGSKRAGRSRDVFVVCRG
jgi:hypothetical protein